jgi:hypothetical protein
MPSPYLTLALDGGRSPPVPVGQEAKGVPEPVWLLWRIEQALALTGNRSLQPIIMTSRAIVDTFYYICYNLLFFLVMCSHCMRKSNFIPSWDIEILCSIWALSPKEDTSKYLWNKFPEVRTHTWLVASVTVVHVIKYNFNYKVYCKILGFHSGDYEEWRLLGCHAMWLL